MLDRADEEREEDAYDVTPKDLAPLVRASTALLNELFRALHVLDDRPDEVQASAFVTYLPVRYLPRYTVETYRKFFVCVVTVAGKLSDPHPTLPLPLTCVGEDLALRAIIAKARSRSRRPDKDEHFDFLVDVLCEDTDVELLFDPARDGLDESPFGAVLGMASLRLADWFTPYRGRGPVHPYLRR